MLKRKLLTTAILAITCSAHAKPPANISLQQIGTYETGVFAESAAEIVAYDEKSQQLFVINAQAKTVDILDISDPMGPVLAGTIDVSLELPDAGGVNSVAVHKGLVAIAVEHDDKHEDRLQRLRRLLMEEPQQRRDLACAQLERIDRIGHGFARREAMGGLLLEGLRDDLGESFRELGSRGSS